MMVLAWMFFASIGVLMPRHLKTAWSQWKPFGKQVWFVIHQPFMILAALLTLIGIVLAFVEAQGYSNMSGFKAAHPPIGITVGVLVVINPIMSLFRCTPDDPRRSIFNIAHLLVGQSAHLLAGIKLDENDCFVTLCPFIHMFGSNGLFYLCSQSEDCRGLPSFHRRCFLCTYSCRSSWNYIIRYSRLS
ncbi:hypothetical protein CAPTEDRAFT_206433 [Capitella teleta]|uniref:Cytochrome b561 domain-containing protein n=1 Tax=Capitella teleta TaxID=283909 RepID=R7TF01_CAPTE|nr:hypothetical protein CAPTEDRAFT_206433 [Capitella teleta]|eukprot:ELT90057.1 hypothetical protein CAPTEDRAFT_206433 [Capitella teleta]